MIGFLKGQIIDTDGNSLILMVGNVGYRIRVKSTDVDKYKSTEAEFFIHTYVREDELSLYGFPDKKSLKMFELLIGVSGVGPKMAMAVLDHGSAEELQKAVAMADVSYFTKVKGIGKKNGQRIIVDLKGKLGSLEELDLGDDTVLEDDLVQALVSMGFEQRRVLTVLGGIDRDLSESEIIKVAIRMLSGK